MRLPHHLRGICCAARNLLRAEFIPDWAALSSADRRTSAPSSSLVTAPVHRETAIMRDSFEGVRFPGNRTICSGVGWVDDGGRKTQIQSFQRGRSLGSGRQTVVGTRKLTQLSRSTPTHAELYTGPAYLIFERILMINELRRTRAMYGLEARLAT